MLYPTLLRLSFLLLLAGCGSHYLSLRQIPIDASYLASSHVHSPDPRQEDPPYGQKILMRWSLPQALLKQNPKLVFYVVYRNHTQEEMIYPICHTTGSEIFSLLNASYQEKGGLLTYKAEIQTEDGSVYTEWKHQLWVRLVTFNTSDSVSSQPKQGSVTETPY